MLLAAPLLAQEPARDTSKVAVPLGVARDSLAADSVATDSVPRDTVKAPLAVAPRPALPEIRGRRTTWDREAIFASGALTLPELLAQVPGVTAYFSGFIAAPTAAAWYGQPGRVRVLLDGVELDALDPRDGGVRDLATIQLWSLEEVAVERAAGELRVFLRSWRVRLTTAQTRTDITTGSENANLYRGFFGKRTERGGVIQLAAQQFSTTSPRTAGDGDALAAFTRLGFARGRLTVDAVGTRYGRNRAPVYRYVVGGGTLDQNAIARFEGNDATAYLRAAWGDADSSGFWMQGIVAASRHQETGDSTAGADTTRAQGQYVAMAGFSRWGARLSASARLRVQRGETRFAPGIRASWERDWFTVSANAEDGGPDSTRRLDAIAALMPFPWLHLSAAHSIHTPEENASGGPARTTSRLELAGRVYGRWVGVGAVQRSAARILGMPVFDAAFVGVDTSSATGLEASLSGKVWRSFSLEWRGVRWAEPGPFAPQVESRTELRFAPDLRRRFPRGTFDFVAGLTHDYRGTMFAPAAGGAPQRVQGAGWVSGYMEMRLGSARIFWYNRNAGGKIFETVPGYLMPRLVQLYGVRWEFWN